MHSFQFQPMNKAQNIDEVTVLGRKEKKERECAFNFNP